MHDLQACKVLILYVRAVAIINSMHSSTEDQVNLQALILFLSDHSHGYSIKTEEKHQVTVSVRAVCMHFPFLSLWPSFCSLFFTLASDQIVPVIFLYCVLFPLWICPKDIEAYHHLLTFPSFPVLNCTSEKRMWKIWQWILHARKNCC